MNEPELGRFVQTGTTRTNVHEHGSGPALLLLHGSGPGVSAWSNWAQMIPTLARRFHVIAPDLAGFGYSETPAGQRYKLPLWIEQVRMLLDALRVRSAHVVGNSFGGTVALAVAAAQAERVKTLMLLGTPAGDFPLTEGMRIGRVYEPSLENMATVLRQFPYDPSVVTVDMVRQRYEASLRPGAGDAVRSLMPEPPPVGATIHGFPEELLRSISVPSLIVHGRDDPVVPLTCSLTLHRCLQRSELRSFGQCGHWVQIERRAEFAQLVMHFAAANDTDARRDLLEQALWSLTVDRRSRIEFLEAPQRWLEEQRLTSHEGALITERHVAGLASAGVSPVLLLNYWLRYGDPPTLDAYHRALEPATQEG